MLAAAVAGDRVVEGVAGAVDGAATGEDEIFNVVGEGVGGERTATVSMPPLATR